MGITKEPPKRLIFIGRHLGYHFDANEKRVLFPLFTLQ
mgnify:FL=1